MMPEVTSMAVEWNNGQSRKIGVSNLDPSIAHEACISGMVRLASVGGLIIGRDKLQRPPILSVSLSSAIDWR